MSFEAHIADHVKVLEKKLSELEWKRRDMQHSCDCDYCDYDGLSDDYTEEDLEEVDKKIAGINHDLKAIKKHARLHQIEVGV